MDIDIHAALTDMFTFDINLATYNHLDKDLDGIKYVIFLHTTHIYISRFQDFISKSINILQCSTPKAKNKITSRVQNLGRFFFSPKN